jgi:hypothetical protein
MGRTVRSVQSIQKADVVLVKSEDRVKAIEKAIDLTGLNLSMERTW